jgi:3-hydroxy acid dehydrogenase/malonic semialdehyde reductase
MHDQFQQTLQELATKQPARPLTGMKALVTGASAGIGLATALALAGRGAQVVGVARRQDRLHSIAQFIADPANGFTGSFRGIVADATAPEFMANLQHERALDADIVVCNAGLARGLSPASQISGTDLQEMINTNFTSVVELVRAILPGMIERGHGAIVGLSSIAAYQYYENGNVYCATKAALRAFFQSVRQETCGQNIRINMVSPGLVETEFSNVRFRGDEARAKNVYAGIKPLTAVDIAAEIIHILDRPDHVNIDDLIILPVQQGSVYKISRKSE